MSAARVAYGALKAEEHALRRAYPPAPDGTPWRARVDRRRDDGYGLHERIEIARGLLRLQACRMLQVWIDAERITVAPWTDWMRPVGETRTVEHAHAVSWKRAAQIVDRGGLG